MQHKSVVRKRVVGLTGEGPLASGAEVKAGEASIGSVGSVAGGHALGLVRLDRALEARAKGQALTAGEAVVTVDPDVLDRYAAATGKGTGTEGAGA